jgi:hypothetical protein
MVKLQSFLTSSKAMAGRVAFDISFGSKDFFCFNYTDPRKVTPTNLPPNVKDLFGKEHDPPVTEVSCLALGPDLRCAIVYRSQDQWFISENNFSVEC